MVARSEGPEEVYPFMGRPKLLLWHTLPTSDAGDVLRTLVLLLLALPITARAAPLSQRIQRLLDKDNSEKATQVCQKHVDADTVQADPAAMRLCADLMLIKLDTFSPGEERLVEFARFWKNTPAQARVITRIWKMIESRGDLEEVRLFPRHWPAAPEVAQARALEHKLAFALGEKLDSQAGWKEFVEFYPAHPRAKEGQARWHAVIYRDALKINTRKSWEAFLAQWPRHPRRGEAEALRIDAAYREALQGGTRAEVLALGHEFPHDSRAAFFRGIQAGVKLPAQAVHGHLTTSIGSPVVPLKIWQRHISIDTTNQPVSRVELMMIHKKEKKPRPFADAWPTLQARERIPSTHKITGMQMTWAKGDGRVEGDLPWPLCQPTDPDLAYGLAIHLASAGKPTAYYAPLGFELPCASLAAPDAFPSSRKAVLQALPKGAVSSSEEYPPGNMQIKLARPVKVMGFSCKDTLRINDRSWGCTSNGVNQAWTGPIADGVRADFFLGTLVQSFYINRTAAIQA